MIDVKKIILILLILVLLSLIIKGDYVCCPTDFDEFDEARTLTGKAMFLFLRDPPQGPKTSPVGENEIHDLIDFVLNPLGNCSANGPHSNKRIIDIAKRVDNVGDAFCVFTPTPMSYFEVENNAGTTVATFDSFGNVSLNGACNVMGCIAPADDAFIVQNPSGSTVAFIDDSGNLCIEQGDCLGNDPDCSAPGDGAFVVVNASDSVVAYINSTGGLCLKGKLT